MHAPRAAAAGCLVIDNTSQFRMDPDVPLVIPEVNPQALGKIRRGIIANPNCSTIQMLVALKPLHDRFKIKRVVVATYQSVSGAGKEGMDELFRQTKASFVNDPAQAEIFTKPIAFNVIPHIDAFLEDGSTKEEWKMVGWRPRRSWTPTSPCTRPAYACPVFIGHSEAVNVEFHTPVTVDEARQVLRDAPGVVVMDTREDGGYITPIECAGEDATFVSRLRRDPTIENGLAFWCVSDNLRKGAALNAVQIAETVVAMKLLEKKAA